MSEIRNRISKRITVFPRDLKANDGNWRLHPLFQRSAVRGLVEEIGIVKPLMIYDSVRYGGLTIVDGHLRSDEYPDVEWPADLLDLTDEEADKVLAMLDKTGEWADRDPEKLDALIQQLETSDPGINAAKLRIMREDEGTLAAIKRLRGQDGESKSEGEEKPNKFAYDRKPLVRVALPVTELPDFEAAIKRTGIKNRGQALLALSRYYLENVPE